ncbi:coiled-coil domain-containing protein 127-like [Ptychodera flava]|uniref:coiled-coil domain-containing protein 127-like n=1 Tax=Ptychodera flava TaxID=63121 RepID=UPI00396A0095
MNNLDLNIPPQPDSNDWKSTISRIVNCVIPVVLPFLPFAAGWFGTRIWKATETSETSRTLEERVAVVEKQLNDRRRISEDVSFERHHKLQEHVSDLEKQLNDRRRISENVSFERHRTLQEHDSDVHKHFNGTQRKLQEQISQLKEEQATVKGDSSERYRKLQEQLSDLEKQLNDRRRIRENVASEHHRELREQIANLEKHLNKLFVDLKEQNDAHANYLKKRRDYEQRVLVEEEKNLQAILLDMEETERKMRKRQDIYCSRLKSKSDRDRIEKDLLNSARRQPYDKEYSFSEGMQNILDEEQGDTHCGDSYFGNGRRMWKWLNEIKAQAHIKKHERIYKKMCEWEKENTF